MRTCASHSHPGTPELQRTPYQLFRAPRHRNKKQLAHNTAEAGAVTEHETPVILDAFSHPDLACSLLTNPRRWYRSPHPPNRAVVGCKGQVTPPTTTCAGRAWRTALSSRKAGTVYNGLNTLDIERACGRLFCGHSYRVILALRCCLAREDVGRCDTQDTT